jgi:hypothetical protein
MNRLAVFAILTLAAVTVGAQLDEATIAAPPAKPQPVEVLNFPDPQNVAGTVSVDNLPPVQPISGTVDVGNLPIDGDGAVIVSSTAATPSYNVIDLLSSETWFDFGDDLYFGPYDTTEYNLVGLRIQNGGCEGSGELRVFLQWRWSEDQSFMLPTSYDPRYGAGASHSVYVQYNRPVLFAPIQGTEMRIWIQAGCDIGQSINHLSVLLKKE